MHTLSTPTATFQKNTILCEKTRDVLKGTRRAGLALMLVASPLASATPPLIPFSLPITPTSENLTNLSSWNEKPAGWNGFIVAKDSHLYAGEKRIRFLGVNIVAGSAFPKRQEADQISARLARFGINIVRLHHLDTRPAPDGLLKADMQTLDPEQLDRLDYFVSSLKKQGIYIDLNLHVGRTYPGFPGWGPTTPKYWKGVDNFYPDMIRLQKEFAKDLLWHTNPYTKLQYAADPAVAIIEINNENGLLHEWRIGALDNIAEPYQTHLQKNWFAWLKKKYPESSGQWPALNEYLLHSGNEQLSNLLTSRAAGEKEWVLQTTNGAQASLTIDQTQAYQFQVTTPGTEPWNAQIHHKNLSLDSNQPYTLKFRLRSDGTFKLRILASQDHAPWNSLWQQTITVTPEWQNYTFTFWPGASEANARLTLNGIGNTKATIWLRGASFQPSMAESSRHIGNGKITPPSFIPSTKLSSYPPKAQQDWINFLWDTESNYWQSMAAFLRNELKVQSLLIGTPANYSPGQIQGALDIVDAHAYWQHPSFTGTEWDTRNWQIGNTPMAGTANAGTIADLALRRIPGKPFVVTEYNHPAPSLYQGEALPLIAAYAGLQDWDGIFVYSYGAHHGWQTRHVDDYFDIHANPIKMVSLVAAAALFRRNDIATATSNTPSLPSITASINAMRTRPDMPSAEYLGAARTEALRRPVSLATAPGKDVPLPVQSTTGELTWGAGQNRTTVLINAPRSKALIGEAGQRFPLGNMSIEITGARDNRATVIMTTLQSQTATQPGRYLLTVLGQMENTDQRWTDDLKISVGENWGRPPVLIERVEAKIDLPFPANLVRAWALDEEGNRRNSLPIINKGHAQIQTNTYIKTLWYEIEATPSP